MSADPTTAPFLTANFEASTYWNSLLPNTTKGTGNSINAPLPEISSTLQSTLSQLNAQTVRVSNTLNTQADEIIRSGGRLEYEVDVLRGEVGSLEEMMGALEGDVGIFLGGKDTSEKGEQGEQDETMARLKQLTTVRARLESVIKLFGDAMAWPLPPPSTNQFLLSVSAPEDTAKQKEGEEKAKVWVEALEREIDEVVDTPGKGIQVAEERVARLRDLAGVWKGTPEERERLKIAERLEKRVEQKKGSSRQQKESGKSGNHSRPPTKRTTSKTEREGHGFLQNLRNLTNEFYVD
ncbi:hypothetical protein K470DRAFT_253999 [Piedraia hortae CBS 480.64]|uniref:Uncharacterized protein n=1 Tax=Piedraia hortae CBS 480.64 TaxID=1314780 RepID=A0A6A7CD72_9PEZI|nr:hypothetical protein K470DRAFT_253999 [Piedraia hortae CBS 480.64]